MSRKMYAPERNVVEPGGHRSTEDLIDRSRSLVNRLLLDLLD
jgi:hypothetical protein